MNSSVFRVSSTLPILFIIIVLSLVPGTGGSTPSSGKAADPATNHRPVSCRQPPIFSRVADKDPWLSTVAPLDPEAWKVVCLEVPASSGTTRAEFARSPLWLDIMGARAGGDVYLELPEWGLMGPAHVTTVKASPVLEPGHGRLITGFVRRILEDSTGVDTLCYLEAHRFELESERLGTVWDRIRQFRRKARISRNKGTVAYLNMTGKSVFGVNSSLDDDIAFVDEAHAGALRRSWHDRLEPTYPYGRAKSRYLVHAEGHVLMRAFRELGYLPPEVSICVDRETCHWCRDGLGKLMGAMGIRTLKIWQKGNPRPLILKSGDPAGGRTGQTGASGRVVDGN